MVGKLPPNLRRIQTTGYTCSCCRDTGRHFSHDKYINCDHCGKSNLNDDILRVLPTTCGDMSRRLNIELNIIKDAVEILHNCNRVKFKNNGKDSLMVIINE